MLPNDDIDLLNADRGDDLPPSDPPKDEPKDPPKDEPKGEEDEAAPKGDSLDPEGDETPEEKAEREKAEAEAEAKRRIRIPKARFDEAQAKARAREQQLLEQIAELKGQKKQEEVRTTVGQMREKITELEDRYEDLILDGKKEEARKVRQQVAAMRDQLVEHTTTIKSEQARKAAIDQLTYDAQLASVESQYPILNPDSDEFNDEIVQEVADLIDMFTRAGTSRAAALTKAVKYVLGAPPEPKKAPDAGSRLAQQRAEEARRKAADANQKQPASMTKAGLDSDKAGAGNELGVDVLKLSQDKFSKLDEETKARLRGDVVE
jgi:hypothetical protein